MTSAAELIVVGPHHSASLTLLQLLGAKQPASGTSLHTWHVNNKYYTASIPCYAATTATSAEDCQGCEALVLVFDPAQQESFQQVQSWWQTVQEQRAEVHLVVAMFASKEKYLCSEAREPWLQAAEQWCSEQLLEYIEMCSTEPKAVRTADSSEGAQGLARAVEALQSHMWPSAEMRPQPGAGLPPSTAAARAAASPSVAGHAAAAAAASADTKEQPDQVQGDLLADDDAALDAFERLIADMQGARTRLSGLSDDKRRAAAAQLAMRMAALMCGEEEDGEEFSDDDSVPEELSAA